MSDSNHFLASLVLLAWRNLWRNKRRTGIMIAAIGVGVWAMIFMSALMRGMVDDMLARGITQLPGHVQIHHPQYLDDPSIVNSFSEPDGELSEVLSGEFVTGWFSRLKVPGVIASERDSRGIIMIGVDPNLERVNILSNTKISEGRFLEESDDSGIVIGEKLAQRLETRLGKRVVIMTQDPDNDLAEKGVRIVGIYQAELPSQEEMFIYIGKQSLQELTHTQGLISEVAVFGDDYRDVNVLYENISAAASSDVAVKPWYEVNRFLGSTLSLMDGFVFVWITIVFIALSFGLANTLVMAVFERVREIGLMMALGMRPLLILAQILVESIFLLIVGLLIGNVLAFTSVQMMADGIDLSAVAEGFEMAGMGTILYPLLLLKDVITANVVVFVLGIVTSFIPAWQASQYDPIRALNKAT